MSLRYITIPKPFQNANGAVPFQRLLLEMGLQPMWRQDEAWANAFVELCEAFEDKAPGDVVEVPQEHWDKLKQSLAQVQPPIEIMLDFMRLVRGIASSPSKRPQSAPTPEVAQA